MTSENWRELEYLKYPLIGAVLREPPEESTVVALQDQLYLVQSDVNKYRQGLDFFTKNTYTDFSVAFLAFV